MPEPDSGGGSPPRDWTLAVDRERCMGTGTCMTYAPGALHFDDDGRAAVDEPVTDDLEAVRAAVESCPTQALAVVGDQS